MTVAFLFPGQGSQRAGMLDTLPASGAVLDESRSYLDHLGLPRDIDSAAALHDTTNVQVCLLIAGVACARTLIDGNGIVPRFVAGHSVGAFAAAVTAHVLSLTEALTAVHRRAEWMKEACAQGSWGMAALTGLPTRDAGRLVESVQGSLWVANINSATQTVLSGSATALRAAQQGAAAADFEVLDVAVASHCPLQATTAQRMTAHLADVPRRPPTARYLTNVGGRAVATADAILDDLAQSVAAPVQWYQASRVLPELGVTCAIEMLPGHVLTRLNASNAPGVTSLSVQDNGIEAIVRRAKTSAV